MAKRKLLADICEELYDDAEVRQAVIDDANRLGHAAKIESGELVLPGEQDANHWHARLTGRIDETKIEREQRGRIKALEDAVAALIDPNAPPSKEYLAKLHETLTASGR
jgi:hypothetical protein